MRFHGKQYLGVFAGLILALPVWARANSATLIVSHPAQIGSEQLQSGTYTLRVEEGQNELQVLDGDGSLVAKVPCQWIQLPAKAANTDVVINSDRVVEVDFGGKTEAVQIKS